MDLQGNDTLAMQAYLNALAKLGRKRKSISYKAWHMSISVF